VSDQRDDPEFGPSGYLPERASKRARKIVLRAPLGVQWIWASVGAGLLVLVAGVLFLSRADAGPRPPYERVAALDAIDDVALDAEAAVLYVTAAGRPRAFDVTGLDHLPTYCEASRQLESADGRAWSLTGRGLAGTGSLREFPTVVFEADLYVDPTTVIPGPPASDRPADLGCRGPAGSPG
jgi:hypothetical protein